MNIPEINYRPIVFIATILFCVLDGIHFLVGIAASSESRQYKDYYHGTWIINVLTTVTALFATGVGAYTIYKDYHNSCDLKKYRAYDIFNLIAGFCIFIGLISAGNTIYSYMAHMYFNFTATLYVLKLMFSSVLIGRLFYINYSTPMPTATPAASGTVGVTIAK